MRGKENKILVAGLFLALFILSFVSSAEVPTGPDEIDVLANESKTAVSGKEVNISGGRIATLNLNATVQNPRWKAFVGNVTGHFTLDGADGSTIYDWSLSVTTGRVFSTRNDSTPEWTSIDCATETDLEEENQELNHTNQGDNITATFNDTTHDGFYVGSTFISGGTCPTLNTYRSGSPQDTYFEEMALYDTSEVIYATIMEQDEVGFDGSVYDFQMLVPERGGSDFQGSTAYYLYVELD